jgi:hypothetical protein
MVLSGWVSDRPYAGTKSQKRRPQASVEDVRTTGRIAEGWPSTTLSHCSGVPETMRCAKVEECAMRGL